MSRENEQLPIERQERQRVEENLRQSKTRLQLALDASEMGTFLWHIEDDRSEPDTWMLCLFGLPPNVRLTLFETSVTPIHPDDRTSYAEAVARATDPDGDGSLRQEIRVVRPNGSVQWLAISGQTFFESDSRRAVQMAGIAANITDRKLAQVALQRSEARLRAVAANLPNGAVFIVDRELCYQLAAGKALEQAGMTPEDLVGKTIWEALDPELATTYEPYFRQALNGEPYGLEHHSHDRDYASYGVPLFDAQGGVEAVLAVSYDITERKLAEVALRESEQRFRLMADAVPQIVWITDAQGRVEFFNKQWSDYTGAPYEPTTAAQVAANFVHPEDGDRTTEAFNEARRSGSVFSVEHRIRSAEGAYRWFLVRAEPYQDPQTGEIVRWFGASVDIHERKQAEEAIREREQRLAIATEAAQLGIFEWKVPEDITSWENDRQYELFGLTPADGSVSAQEFFENYLHSDDAEALTAKLTQAMQRGSLLQTSYRICRKDGTMRWLEVNGQFEFAADGSPLRFVGVNADITDRKQAEATIVQQEAQFRQLADAMPQQVWITDAQGNTQYVNQQWTTYTGLTLKQTQDIHYATQVIHPDGFEITSELWSTALTTGTPYQAEFRLKHSSDNTYRWFLSRAIAIRDEQGQIVQWFGTSTDIEEFRRAQTQREQLLQQEQTARETAENANRIKDEFLAVLSHELRSPLNPILGWSKLLQQSKLDTTRTKTALATIERNAQLQAQLIDDLLDISRILRGKLSLNEMPVDLRMVISSALETVHLAAEAKALDIQTKISPDVGAVMGDAGRLQQVVWNLLSNAVKFTPPAGQVTVSLTQTGTDAQIQVTDTGKGINTDFLPYVFEHFRQEDGATTRKFGGLGLGLAIARQIVELHGGTIAVASPGEGQGATFTVQLLLAPVSSQTLSSAFSSVSTDGDLSDIHILVVDDEPDSREFVAFVLEQAGAIVTSIASGIEALQTIDRYVFDLIVSDIGMPEMDGYMLMQQIRARSPAIQVPAIALTAYAGEFDRQQALAAGFQRHLAKPVEPTEIVTIAARLCGRKENA